MLPQHPGHTVEPRGRTGALTRDVLRGRPRRRLHSGRNLTKAVVDVVDFDGRAIVVKDMAPRPWIVRRLLGPWQMDREARAYEALHGVEGVPVFLGRLDRQAIAIEFIPGSDLAAVRPGDLPGTFFDRLERLVASLHARGVAHGDLHRHDVLRAADGRPFIVDYSTSIVVRARSGAWTRFLFGHMSAADRRSIAKLRRRFLPGAAVAVPERSGPYRAGPWLRRVLGLGRRRR